METYKMKKESHFVKPNKLLKNSYWGRRTAVLGKIKTLSTEKLYTVEIFNKTFLRRMYINCLIIYNIIRNLFNFLRKCSVIFIQPVIFKNYDQLLICLFYCNKKLIEKLILIYYSRSKYLGFGSDNLINV